MTTVTASNTVNTLASGQKKATSNGSTLDQEDFLKLLTTQLKTQDPTDPVDNSQMAAQLAQFSSVSGINEMNVSLKGIASDISAQRVGDAASWIGRAALVQSDTASQLSNGGYAGEVALPEDTTDATLSLVDANGRAVHSEALGTQAKGSFAFSWAGEEGVSGPLKVVVSGRTAEGVVSPTVSTWTEINGVQSPASGSTKLVTPLGLIDPQDTLRLS